ncbi:hypothetical protein ACTJJB_22550 [Chitinophaga sp. 22536]|uniref:hypothetical protein n=1 Tax=unclassified Chitinophaga TaxID=2619133 RepID=UPI003F83EB2B
MKKNTSIRTTTQHRKIPLWLWFAHAVSLYPRLLLETFIRRNFGRRYYSFSNALKIAFVLAVLPLFFWFPVFHFLFPALFPAPGYSTDTPTYFWAHYATWYAFIAAFLVCAVQRKREAMKNRNMTTGLGTSFPFFDKIRLFGQPLTGRFIETIAEPLFTFLIGWFLYKLGEKIGIVIMVSSVCYSISYLYAYRSADEKLMDMHDDQQSGTVYRDALSGAKQPPQADDAENVS